jgi:LysM repeat protein
MQRKRGLVIAVLLLVLLILLTGCFQQAGESFTPVDGQPQQNIPPQATPTQIGNNPSETTTGSEASPTSDTESSSVENQPTPEVAITIISPTRPVPVANTPVSEGGQETGVETPTSPSGQFVTPLSPLGPITPDTPVPVEPGQASTATPSGLITPTALPGADNTEACTHTVQPGETLFRIAVKNNLTVSQLQQANPQLGNGDLIHPGDVLKIPNCNGNGTTSSNPPPSEPSNMTAPSGGQVYTVQRGDTLTTIAQHFGVTVRAIQDANNISDPNRLSVGQQLVIPPKSG